MSEKLLSLGILIASTTGISYSSDSEGVMCNKVNKSWISFERLISRKPSFENATKKISMQKIISALICIDLYCFEKQAHYNSHKDEISA